MQGHTSLHEQDLIASWYQWYPPKIQLKPSSFAIFSLFLWRPQGVSMVGRCAGFGGKTPIPSSPKYSSRTSCWRSGSKPWKTSTRPSRSTTKHWPTSGKLTGKNMSCWNKFSLPLWKWEYLPLFRQEHNPMRKKNRQQQKTKNEIYTSEVQSETFTVHNTRIGRARVTECHDSPQSPPCPTKNLHPGEQVETKWQEHWLLWMQYQSQESPEWQGWTQA